METSRRGVPVSVSVYMQNTDIESYPIRKQKGSRLALKLSAEESREVEKLGHRMKLPPASVARMVFGLGLSKTDCVYSSDGRNALFVSPAMIVSVTRVGES